MSTTTEKHVAVSELGRKKKINYPNNREPRKKLSKFSFKLHDRTLAQRRYSFTEGLSNTGQYLFEKLDFKNVIKCLLIARKQKGYNHDEKNLYTFINSSGQQTPEFHKLLSMPNPDDGNNLYANVIVVFLNLVYNTIKSELISVFGLDETEVHNKFVFTTVQIVDFSEPQPAQTPHIDMTIGGQCVVMLLDQSATHFYSGPIVDSSASKRVCRTDKERAVHKEEWGKQTEKEHVRNQFLENSLATLLNTSYRQFQLNNIGGHQCKKGQFSLSTGPCIHWGPEIGPDITKSRRISLFVSFRSCDDELEDETTTQYNALSAAVQYNSATAIVNKLVDFSAHQPNIIFSMDLSAPFGKLVEKFVKKKDFGKQTCKELILRLREVLTEEGVSSSIDVLPSPAISSK